MGLCCVLRPWPQTQRFRFVRQRLINTLCARGEKLYSFPLSSAPYCCCCCCGLYRKSLGGNLEPKQGLIRGTRGRSPTRWSVMQCDVIFCRAGEDRAQTSPSQKKASQSSYRCATAIIFNLNVIINQCARRMVLAGAWIWLRGRREEECKFSLSEINLTSNYGVPSRHGRRAGATEGYLWPSF